MSKGKISYFPAHHLRRNSIGQQYERRNWKRLMGAILRTDWSAIFDLFRTLHGKGERLCPGGSFAAVLDAVSSPVQRALHSFTKMHLDWLEDIVREGVARGQFTIGEQRPRDADLRERPGRADTRPPHIGSRTSSMRSRQSCDVLWVTLQRRPVPRRSAGTRIT